MSLLDEIKSDLVNEKAKLTNTLRKAKILASQLQLDEFKNWIRFELEGYDRYENLPGYRKFKAHNFGTFSGPFQSMIKNVTLPTYNLPASIRDFAENLDIYKSIGELESMLSSSADSLQEKWSQEAIILARDSMQMSGGMVLVDAYKPITKHLVAGIIDNVKNKLMDFVLDLKASKIPLDSEKLESRSKNQIRNLFNVHIYGDHNIVASGEKVIQSSQKVTKNDIKSLLNYFKNLEVHPEDIALLEKAVVADGKTEKGQLGKRIKEWVGNMISKASSGIWKVALDVAPKLIMEALKNYYGW